MLEMDDIDRRILTDIQNEFPLVHEPFKVLGEQAGISAEEALERVSRLKREAVIRQISAIFDTKSLGYQSTLVAMKFDPARLDEAAEVINQHPGVSHNYRRSDDFNLWFTVAVPPYDSLEATIDKLHELSGAIRTLILPTLKLFKIGVKLDLTGSEQKAEKKEDIYDEAKRNKVKPKLTEWDVRFIRVFQDDLPLKLTPYVELAEQCGMSEEEFFAKGKEMIGHGYLRRVAAILHHRKAGFGANDMVVWQIPADKQDEVGDKMAQFPQVSHCYKRPVFSDWPYSLYTMIHGKKAEDCEKIVQKIIAQVGSFEHKNLYSTKEYKKIRLKYFTEELDNWWKLNGQNTQVPVVQ